MRVPTRTWISQRFFLFPDFYDRRRAISRLVVGSGFGANEFDRSAKFCSFEAV